MDAQKNIYISVVRTREGKGLIGRPWLGWENNTKMNLKEVTVVWAGFM
jgi:hypothetical protein